MASSFSRHHTRNIIKQTDNPGRGAACNGASRPSTSLRMRPGTSSGPLRPDSSVIFTERFEDELLFAIRGFFQRWVPASRRAGAGAAGRGDDWS